MTVPGYEGGKGVRVDDSAATVGERFCLAQGKIGAGWPGEIFSKNGCIEKNNVKTTLWPIFQNAQKIIIDRSSLAHVLITALS